MTPQQLNKKRALFLLLVAYFIVGYLLINYFNQHRSHCYDVVLPFEEGIPFLPVFILGYLLVYASIIIVYFKVNEFEQIKKAALLYFVLTTVHYVLFLIFPVRMLIRPEIVSPNGFSETLAALYFAIDEPYNCFPSLHVSYALLSALVLRGFKWSLILYVMTIITAFSVVMVKQHYIMDVAAGGVVTVLVYYFSSNFWCRGKLTS